MNGSVQPQTQTLPVIPAPSMQPGFNQKLGQWIANAPRGEKGERTNIANLLQKARTDGTTSLLIQDSSITTLPPLPEHITELRLKYCQKLKSTSDNQSSPDNLSGLETLDIYHSQQLTSITGNFSLLSTLKISFCPRLQRVSDDMPNLQNLEKDNCPQLTERCGNQRISDLLRSEAGNSHALPFNVMRAIFV